MLRPAAEPTSPCRRADRRLRPRDGGRRRTESAASRTASRSTRSSHPASAPPQRIQNRAAATGASGRGRSQDEDRAKRAKKWSRAPVSVLQPMHAPDSTATQTSETHASERSVTGRQGARAARERRARPLSPPPSAGRPARWRRRRRSAAVRELRRRTRFQVPVAIWRTQRPVGNCPGFLTRHTNAQRREGIRVPSPIRHPAAP